MSEEKHKKNSLDPKIIKAYNKLRKSKMRKHLCHAPFKSLTFFLAGDILACWYNKQYILGHYPQDKIRDVWFGEKAEKLRNGIKINDLSSGCNECKRHFKDFNFQSTGAWQYDRLSEKEQTYPVSLDFQISNLCNLECIMCHGEYSSTIRQNREKKPAYPNPYDSNFVKQLEEFIPHLKRASFTGGEVFLIKIYHEIWEKISQFNPETLISITTNATILNQKEKDILEKLRFNVTLSIDSIQEKSYEAIRKNANHSKMIENLDYYVKYTKRKKTSLSARICPMQQNWEELPSLYDYLNERNVRMYFNTVIFPSYSSLWNLKSEKLKEVIDHLSKHILVVTNKIQKSNKESYHNLIEQLKRWYKKAIERENQFPEIDKYDIEQLIELLTSEIEKYFNSSEIYNPEDKLSFLDFFKEVMNTCNQEISDVEIFRNALIHFLGFPINRLIDEFQIRNIEKLVDLTKQAGQTDISYLYD